MRFLLCARDRKTGAVSIVSGRAYASRAEAIDSLATAGTAAGLGDSDLFVVDLDAATPVVMVTGGGPTAAPVTIGMPPVEESVETEIVIEEWPFVPSDDDGGVGPSTLTRDLPVEDADRAQVWWLETGVPEPEPAAETAPGPAVPEAAAPAVAPDAVATEPNEGLETPAAPIEEAEPSAPEAEEPEASPKVDFEVWACSDCVFIATCPLTETQRPANCGSFQWKPE